MKNNKISIVINCSVEKVFEISINPNNTPLWISGIIREETNEFPVKMGTKYNNLSKAGLWSQYKVVRFDKNKVFELKQENSNYHVRYTFETISKNKTRLTYFEWVTIGELAEPFSSVALEKLKKISEEGELSTFKLLRLKNKYYLPFILIIAVILATSWYYATYYPNISSLPCGSIQECIISYGTAMFNGYTETTLSLGGIGNNVYENVLFTIFILLALPTVAILIKKEGYLKPMLVSIILSQIVFLFVYPKLVEPLLTSTPNFGGGLSLFDTFSLIAIVIIILVNLFNKCMRLNLVNGKLQFFEIIIYPLAAVGLITYMYLTISNLLSLNSGGIVSNYQTVILAIVVLAALLMILFLFYRKNKTRFSDVKLDLKYVFRFLIMYTFTAGIALGILFSTYLIPAFFFYQGLAFKAVLNPHNFGWPIFITMTLILWKKKLFGFK